MIDGELTCDVCGKKETTKLRIYNDELPKNWFRAEVSIDLKVYKYFLVCKECSNNFHKEGFFKRMIKKFAGNKKDNR